MTPLDKAKKELKNANYHLGRHGRNHDIYVNEELHRSIPLKRHSFDDDDLRYIRKEIKDGQRGREK